jgi:hypothetical protein
LIISNKEEDTDREDTDRRETKVVKEKNTNSLVDLTYNIDEKFELKSEDDYSRYYVYNNSCTIKINTSTNNSESNYGQNILDTYGNDQSISLKQEKLIIKHKIWTTIGVYYPTNTNKDDKDLIERYRYTFITNRGNVYTIVFVNEDEDSKCKDTYMEFVDSLDLKK